MATRDLELSRILRAQHGVIARDQILRIGWSDGYIRTRVRRGEWERADVGVYRVVGAGETWAAQLLAACFSLGGVASHRSAAALWDIGGFSEAPIEVTVPRHRNRRPRAEPVVAHESTQFGGIRVVLLDGIPCTDAARTVLDLAAVVRLDDLNRAVDAGLRAGLFTLDDLRRVVRQFCRRGRNGCGPLRLILDERLGESIMPDSHWNRKVARLLVDSGLPDPVLEHPVEVNGSRYRIDLAYPEQKIAIELDSVRWHLNRESFESDPIRRNDLTIAGWEVLTFTHRLFRERPGRLAATVRAVLLARARTGGDLRPLRAMRSEISGG